jgi:hypothetical protein
MATVGFGDGVMNVSEAPTEVLRRIELCEQEKTRLTMADGGPDIRMLGWFLVTAAGGETVAVQASSVSYVGP